MPTATKEGQIAPPELDNLVKLDPYLEPFKGEIKRR
jgi:hypothetical protein